jgi:hypothetical protein
MRFATECLARGQQGPSGRIAAAEVGAVGTDLHRQPDVVIDDEPGPGGAADAQHFRCLGTAQRDAERILLRYCTKRACRHRAQP